MNIKEFTYTKANGEESNRFVLVTNDTSKFISGIDITELTTAQRASFITKCFKLDDEYRQAMLDIQVEYGVDDKFRQFLPARMTDVKTQTE